MVAVAEFGARLACSFLYKLLTLHALCIHSHERCHAVATVYVKSLSHRAKAVCSVYVATVVAVVLQAPAKLFGVRAVGVLPVVVPEVAQVVDVGALGTQYLAKDAMLCHI